MISLGLAPEARIDDLELEWRMACDATIVARAEYQRLAAAPAASVDSLDAARERLERAEAKKARILWKIEKLEAGMLGHGPDHG
jgi:hypothetical protein